MTTSWEVFRPIRDGVLIKADERVKKTKGGIILTDALTKVERVMEGTGVVLKVGPDVHEDDLKVGERVCYRGFLKDVHRNAFEPIKGCDVFLLKFDDVLMVIPDSIEMGAFS